MARIFDILFVLCLSSVVFVSGQHDHKIKVTVYYESLCPDSIAFINKQLYPALKNEEINKHVNLSLVPYGKSSTEFKRIFTSFYESLRPDSIGFINKQLYPALKNEEISKGVNLSLVAYGKSSTTKDGNDYKFQCHHGQGECKGNKIHACALAKIKPSADGKNKVAFDFINCLLEKVENKKDQTEFPVKTCAESENVGVKAEIDGCASSHEGSQLLDVYGQKTRKLEDPLVSVPTVVFNDKLDPKVNSDAQKDFVATLCKYIDHDKPTDCEPKKGAADLAKPLGITLLTLLALLRVF